MTTSLSFLLPSPLLGTAEWFLLVPVMMLLAAVLVQLILLPLLQLRSYHSRTLISWGLGSSLLSILGALIWLTAYGDAFALAQQSTGSGALFQGMVQFSELKLFQLQLILGLSGLGLLVLAQQDDAVGFPFELYPIFLMALVGIYFLVIAQHLMGLFVAMETLSFALYLMIAFKRTWRGALEASLKYFVLGGVGSILVLYGSILYFGSTGSFSLAAFDAAAAVMDPKAWPLLTVSALLVTAGLLFKVGAFPFHLWVADVYHGAPSAITSWMGAVVKLALFLFLMQFAERVLFKPQLVLTFKTLFFVLGLCSILSGHLMAFGQKTIKRVLAHSAVAQSGYLLLALSSFAHQPQVIDGMTYYLLSYALLNVLIFSTLLAWEKSLGRDILWSDVSGLMGAEGPRSRWQGVILLLGILGMAGFPLTIGFVGKLLLLLGLLQTPDFVPAIIFLAGSALGLAYYLPAIIQILSTLLGSSRLGASRPATTSTSSVQVDAALPWWHWVLMAAQVGIILIGVVPRVFDL